VRDEHLADGRVWECTRLVIDDRVASAEDRTACLGLIVDGLAEVARGHGADRMISLSPLTLQRVLRKFGWDVARVGKPHHNTGDGRRYAMLSMPVRKTLPHAAAPTPVVEGPGTGSVLVAPPSLPEAQVA